MDDFLQYVIDTKTVSQAELDMEEICTRWPYLTYGGVHRCLQLYVTKGAKDKIPLYQKIQTYPREKYYKKSFERKLELVKEFDKLRKNN